MIAACPECAARYRVEDAKVGAKGSRIRCAKCSTIFRITLPGPAVGSPSAEPPGSVHERSSGISPAAPPELDEGPLVLVATSQESLAGPAASALKTWGLSARIVGDGGQAMLAIQRSRPAVVILDTDLPGMNGLQICEVVQRNESLAGIRVVLMSDRDGSEASASLAPFGPDAHCLRANLLDELQGLMAGFGLSLRAGGGPAEAPSSPAEDPVPPAADGLDQERAKAERLARVVISDIVLYQGEAFDRANQAGTLAEDFRFDLAEGRKLLAERLDPRVCSERDHLLEELMRVAEDRRKD